MKICRNHQERQTPLIWTFAFPYAEYWCPYCGRNEGMLGAGTEVEETPELLAIKKADESYSEAYLDAVSTKNCDSLEHEGKRIPPSEMPEEVKARNAAVIAAWVYGHNDGAKRHE